MFAAIASASRRKYSNSGEVTPEIDPDYQAVLNYATANNIPLPDATQQSIDNQSLKVYKATGAWDRNDAFLKFKGTASIAFKLIDWKRLIQVAAYGGLNWSNEGVEGNGVNAYINPLFDASQHNNYSLGNAGVSLVYFKKQTTGFYYDYGYKTTDPGDSDTLIQPARNEVSRFALNSDSLTASTFDSLGLVSLDRFNVDNVKITTPANTAIIQVTGIHTSKGTPYLLARNRSGASASAYSGAGISYLITGGEMSDLHQEIKPILEAL